MKQTNHWVGTKYRRVNKNYTIKFLQRKYTNCIILQLTMLKQGFIPSFPMHFILAHIILWLESSKLKNDVHFSEIW